MNRAETSRREARYEDLHDLPPGVKGEIIDEDLHVQPKARPRHPSVAAILGAKHLPMNGGGSGGAVSDWIVLPEPGVEVPRSPEVVPDFAASRRERRADFDPDTSIRIVPDWVCEILSPSNRSYDKEIKLPLFAKHGVGWLWGVDVAARCVDVKRNVDGKGLEEASFVDDDLARAEPFAGVELHLGSLWLPDKPR